MAQTDTTVQTPPTAITTGSQATANNLNPTQIAQGYSTIPGAFDPVTGQLKSSQPPTNTSAVTTSSPSVNLTTNNAPVGNTTASQAGVAGVQSYIDSTTQLAKDQQTQDQALRDQINKSDSGQAQQSFLQKLLSSSSPDQVKQQAIQQTGIDPATYFAQEKASIAQINSLQTSYNTLNTQLQKQIAQVQGSGFATTDFQNNQIAAINRNAAPQMNALSANINAQTAMLTASQGLFNESQQYVQQAVSDATAVQKYDLDMFTALQTNNQQLFDQLDAPYKAAYTAQQQALNDQYKSSVQTVTDVLNLSVANPKAGILPTDSMAQAVAKVNATGGSLDAQYKKAQINQANAAANKDNAAAAKDNRTSLINANNPTANPLYTIQAGEDPATIATQNGTDIATLQSLNPQITDWKTIQPGTQLKLPSQQTFTGSALDGSRYALQATRIAKNFIALPIYEATANGQVYLKRIASAAANPGTVGDAELLDSIVKLNTSGNAITNEQVQLITGYRSFADSINVIKNKLTNGGALSDNQRNELNTIAQQTFSSYKAGYQPVYDQVTSQLKAANIPQAFWTIPDLNKLSNSSATPASSGTLSSGITYTIQ